MPKILTQIMLLCVVLLEDALVFLFLPACFILHSTLGYSLLRRVFLPEMELNEMK